MDKRLRQRLSIAYDLAIARGVSEYVANDLFASGSVYGILERGPRFRRIVSMLEGGAKARHSMDLQ